MTHDMTHVACMNVNRRLYFLIFTGAEICSEHFTEADYERDLKNELLGLTLNRRLISTALPSRLLNTQSSNTDPIDRSPSKRKARLAEREFKKFKTNYIGTC